MMMNTECGGKSRACPLIVQGQYELQQTQAPWEDLSYDFIIQANT